MWRSERLVQISEHEVAGEYLSAFLASRLRHAAMNNEVITFDAVTMQFMAQVLMAYPFQRSAIIAACLSWSVSSVMLSLLYVTTALAGIVPPWWVVLCAILSTVFATIYPLWPLATYWWRMRIQ